MWNNNFKDFTGQLYRKKSSRIVSITNLMHKTYFEQYHAHLQEVKFYYYSIWYRHSGNK